MYYIYILYIYIYITDRKNCETSVVAFIFELYYPKLTK